MSIITNCMVDIYKSIRVLSLPKSVVSGITLIVSNNPLWEYLHYGNWQML